MTSRVIDKRSRCSPFKLDNKTTFQHGQLVLGNSDISSNGLGRIDNKTDFAHLRQVALHVFNRETEHIVGGVTHGDLGNDAGSIVDSNGRRQRPLGNEDAGRVQVTVVIHRHSGAGERHGGTVVGSYGGMGRLSLKVAIRSWIRGA